MRTATSTANRWTSGRRIHSAVALLVTVALALASPPTAGHATAGAGSSRLGSAADGRIVYVNFQTGQLETVNPDGSARVEVTHEGNNLFPRWMPSGRIIFSSDRGGDGFHLFTIAADGSDPVQVTTTPEGSSDDASAVTPDGSRIVFNRCRFGDQGGCSLFSVAFDGSDLRPVTPFTPDVRDFLPDVSPDGKHLAFHRSDGRRGVFDQIWLARLDGSDAHPITAVATEGASARWSPDGQTLVATDSSAHFGSAVIRVAPSGAHLQVLTDPEFPHSDQVPDPSPSGRQVVFVSDRDLPEFDGLDLYVMRSDGSGPHPITSHAIILWPDWGSAALLPPGAGTPDSALSSTLTVRQRVPLRRALQLSGAGTLGLRSAAPAIR